RQGQTFVQVHAVLQCHCSHIRSSLAKGFGTVAEATLPVNTNHLTSLDLAQQQTILFFVLHGLDREPHADHSPTVSILNSFDFASLKTRERFDSARMA